MGEPVGEKRPWLPLALAAGGVVLFLIAAAGGLPVGGLRIEDNGWRLALSGVGIALVAFGVLRLADARSGSVEPRTNGGDVGTGGCQIEMLRPRRYQRRMRIEGGYLNEPPEGSLRLFTVNEDGRFRPQSIVTFDAANRRWSGGVDLGPGRYYSVYVVVAFVDTSGRALWDYYYQVGRETGWEPIAGRFADYARECDRFLVEGVINE